MVTNSLVFLFFPSLMILMTSQLEGGKVQDSSLCFSQWHWQNCFSFETSDLLPLPQRAQTLMANRTARNLLACESLIQEWSRIAPATSPQIPLFLHLQRVTTILIPKLSAHSWPAPSTPRWVCVSTPQLKPHDWGKPGRDCARKEQYPVTNIPSC